MKSNGGTTQTLPSAHPRRHLTGWGEVDDPGALDAGQGEDFVQGGGRGLAVQGEDADGLAAGFLGLAADGHLGDVHAVGAEDAADLADHAGRVAVLEDHQRAIQVALQVAAGLLDQSGHVVAEQGARGHAGFVVADHLGRDHRTETAQVAAALLDQLDAPFF